MSQIANRKLSRATAIGGLSVNLNHLKIHRIDFFWQSFLNGTRLIASKHIFECNLSPQDHTKICTGSNFWTQLFHHWCKVNFNDHPETCVDIMNQPIWYNSLLRKNNRPIPPPSRNITSEIFKIADYFQVSENRLLSYEELKTLFPNTKLTWLDHQGIIKAIPKNWLDTVKLGTETTEIYEPWIEKVLAVPKIASFLYKCMNRDEQIPMKYLIRWAEKYDLEIGFEDYAKSFTNIRVTTDSVKLRDFQYRLLLDKVPTNSDLFNWKLKDDNKCNFCKTETEDIFHVLLECKFAKRLWKYLTINIGLKENIDIMVTKESIIINSFYKDKHHIFN